MAANAFMEAREKIISTRSLLVYAAGVQKHLDNIDAIVQRIDEEMAVLLPNETI